ATTPHPPPHGNRPCVPLDSDPPPDLPRVASDHARLDSCRYCIETMDLFVSAYGAEAGHPAVRTLATRGVYIGGGIAPKTLPLLERPAFLASFVQKGPMKDLLEHIPIRVIKNPQAGLPGAATGANTM